MFKIGLSSCGKPLNDETFESYTSAGIECMEVSPAKIEYDPLDFKEIYKLSQRHGVKLWSFHLPFVPFGIYDLASAELYEGTVQRESEFIKKAADIGIDKFIIHSSSEEIYDDTRHISLDRASEGLARLADVADSCGGFVAVEDLPRTCLGRNSGEVIALISKHEKLRVCFDTNHLVNENPADFVRKLGDKIITTHVSDYDFVDEKHWLPGEGSIDWQELIAALKEVNYTGAWLYEIGYNAPESMPRSRNLTCEDFARNAKELFAGQTPTIIK